MILVSQMPLHGLAALRMALRGHKKNSREYIDHTRARRPQVDIDRRTSGPAQAMKSTKKLINDPSQTKIWKHKHVVKLQVSAKPDKPSVKKIRPLLSSNTLDHQLVKDFTTKTDKRKKALISEAFQLEKTNENKLITLHLFNLYVDGLIRNGYFKHCKEDIEFITAFNVCYFQVKPLGDDGNWVLEQWCDHYREMAISKAKELDLA